MGGIVKEGVSRGAKKKVAKENSGEIIEEIEKYTVYFLE